MNPLKKFNFSSCQKKSMLKKEIVFIIRKSFYQFVILVGICIFFSFCSDKAQQKKPNVLFIMVDDLRPELNCYGNEQIFSPNIDRLAENGVLFQHAYCQQAICMASRASIFSGFYANTNRIYSCLSINELMPDVEDNEYRDGYYADWVVNKLVELKGKQKPFFLGVGFQKPHLPFNAPQKYWDLYPPESIELASNPFYPENGSSYGKHNFGEFN